MKKLFLMTMLIISTLALAACSDEDTSGLTNSATVEAKNQESENSEVYMTTGTETSYAVPTDYSGLKDSAQYVFTFKPVEALDTVYAENGLIYTIYNVEVTSTIKGDIPGTIPLMIPGGTVTVEEYYNSIDSDSATKQFPNGIESISEQLVVSEEENSVPITIGQEYLTTANYDEETGEYVVLADVYGVYTVNGDEAVNEHTGDVIQSENF